MAIIRTGRGLPVNIMKRYPLLLPVCAVLLACPSAAQESLLIRTVRGSSGIIYSAAYSPDGKSIAYGGVGKGIRHIDPEGADLRSLKGNSGFVNSIAFSPDGGLLASGGEDSAIKLWDAPDCRRTLELKKQFHPSEFSARDRELSGTSG